MAESQHSLLLRLLSDNSVSIDVNKSLELQKALSNTDLKTFNAVLDDLFEDFLDTNSHNVALEAFIRLISSVGANKKSNVYNDQSKTLIEFLMPRITGSLNQKNVEGNVQLFQTLEKFFPSALHSPAYRNMYIIGNYFVTGIVLGSGNFSKVFIGRHRRTAHVAAIKCINMAQQVPQARSMIEREVQMMKQIHHPNIVQLYDVISEGSDLYIVMEYCSGETLESYMKNNPIIPEKTAMYILREICIGLIYLHKKDIIHRDIKPANILLNYDQSLRAEEGFTVKLADFTFAKSTVNALGQTYCGTPLFMSPEMLLGEDGPNQKKNGDLWSVGVIFYQLLFRKLPYPCTGMRQLQEGLRNFFLEFPPTPIITDESKYILSRLLEKNASQRFSFEELEKQITVTKEVERAEENHNREYESLDAEIKLLQTSLGSVLAENHQSKKRQEELLEEISQLELQNEKLRQTNAERDFIIQNLQDMLPVV